MTVVVTAIASRRRYNYVITSCLSCGRYLFHLKFFKWNRSLNHTIIFLLNVTNDVIISLEIKW